MDFTTVVTLDLKHLNQFILTWPTWVRHRPEVMRNPMLIIVDGRDGGAVLWGDKLPSPLHPDCRIIPWNWPKSPDEPITQRERMLTGIVRSVGSYVETPYWLKLDTDVIAMSGGKWYEDEWFEDEPAIVCSPWGYTKPANYIDILDEWGNEHFEMKGYPPLEIHPARADSGVVKHRRIASWCMFGNTVFARWAADLLDKTESGNTRLPVPSQDTYHWYVAKRAGKVIRRVNMKEYGWQVRLNMGSIRKHCEQAMKEPVI